MSTRDDAIALLVEKLREIEAAAHALYASQARALKDIGAMSSQEYLNRRDDAMVHYALADRCEQLIEAITGGLLFDQLDAADAAFEADLSVAEAAGFVPPAEAALRAATVPAAHDVFGNHILDRAQARLGESVKHDVRAAVFADLMFEPIVSGEAL